ncbi:MAG: hypothetical protein WA190_10320, partial [Usitatibacter sp.]
FNGRHHELQPRGGRHGVLRLIRRLVEDTDPLIGSNAPLHEGALNAALGRLRRVSRPGSLIVLIGDFYGLDGESGNHLLHLRQHSDVVAIQVVDPLEEAPPSAARYGVTGSGSRGILDTRSAVVRQAYHEYFDRHHREVAAIMRAHAIALLRLGTNEDIPAALRRHFAARTGPAPLEAAA